MFKFMQLTRFKSMVTREGKHKTVSSSSLLLHLTCHAGWSSTYLISIQFISEVVSGKLLSVLRDKPREETCKVFKVGVGSAQCFDPNLASSVDNAGNASYPYASTSARRSTVVPATRPWTHFFTKSVPAVASKGFKGLVGTLIVSRILKFTFCKSIKTWQGKQTSK